MRKSFKWIFAIFVIVSVFCGIGCKGSVDIKPIEKYGTIEGKAFYSNENVDNHSGIQITLVSTDGLMATDFCSSRGISTNVRSVKDIKTTVKDGSYSFKNIPEGVYTVYASSNSSVEKAVTTNISVNANQIVTAEDLKLTATGAVRGNITIDGSTAGTLGLDVFIAGTSFDGKVGSDGSFELTGIPAKKGYVLCVQKGDYTSIIDSYLEIKANSSVKIQTVNLYSSNWEEDTAVQENPTFKWLGAFANAPKNPKLYEAYFNTEDGCSYIWNGNSWDLLAQAGKDGVDGEHGIDGKDGLSIVWKGSLESAPENPELYWVYYNIEDGCSYIWNGSSWDIISQDGFDGTDGLDGINGTDGKNGVDGLSIVWKGVYSVAPENPELNWAYYNTEDGCSYIWNGSEWDLLAKAGKDGGDGYPCIKDVIIPTAGEGFVGEIPVTIVGENLLGHVITCNDETFTDLTYLDDTVVTAKIKCDGLIGEKEVIVTCGNSRVTGIVKVVATEKCFNVGDILFTDGTRLKFENAKYGIPDAKRGDVFAVIGYAPYGGGTGVCVGLYKNNYVQWAPEGSFGHDKNFVGIQYNFETLYGDIDGSDNWDYICKIDPEGSKNAEVNYPAFHFANTYGSLFGLEGTNYENGWYIPSVYELYEIFKNKENVQQALKSAGGFSFVTEGVSNNLYISSSQSDYYNTNIYHVHFDFDAKYGRSKWSRDNVLVVQSVDCEEFMNYEITSIPKITSIEIPTVGEGYTGDVLVTISGENLAGHEIISDDVSFTNVNCINDKKTTVIIPCDGIVGERDITITIGGVSVTEKLKTIGINNCFYIGDIILMDGTKISVSDVNSYMINENNKPIGVIASVKYGGGTGVCIGLQKDYLQWSPIQVEDSKMFTEIQSEYYDWSDDTKSFTGDLEGRYNWEYVCRKNPNVSNTANINYPVFNYANTYGIVAGLSNTKYEKGWYIPSIKELYDIYTYKEYFANSLILAGGFNINESKYWSSSLDPHMYVNDAYYMDFGNEVITYTLRQDYNYVFAICDVYCESIENGNMPIEPASISNLVIPQAGEGYVGELLITIEGENLKNQEITCDDISFKNLKYISDNKVTATIMCDGLVGESSIEVSCGYSSKVGIKKVVEKEKCFGVGDILFTDGSCMKAEQVIYGVPDKQMHKAFAVIGSTLYGGGTGLGIGLKDSVCEWAPKGTTGYINNFTDIQVNYEQINYDSYSFYGDLFGEDNWDYICSIDPYGTQYAKMNYPAFYFANTYGVKSELLDTDYEIGWYIPSVKELYDIYSSIDLIQVSLTAVNGFNFRENSHGYWTSSQKPLSANEAYVIYSRDSLNFNSKDVSYNVLAIQKFNCADFDTVEITSIPNISNVLISCAGEGYTGELLVTIKGENLKGHEITSSDASFRNVQYISDNLIKATVSSDGNVGERIITVTSGTSSENGTVKVVAAEDCFSVGDILFTDGTRIKAENVKYGVPDELLVKAIGVIGIASYGGGTGSIIGLQRGYEVWAPSGTTGYETDFTGIEVEVVDSNTLTGDLDGSDNWEYICSIDPIGTQNAATNYPIFHYANTYGETAGLTGTEYENGWYVPSIAELYDVYTNSTIIQTSMNAVGGFDVESDYYWSSSQSYFHYGDAYELKFSNGRVDYGNYYKDNCCNVLVLQSISAE